MTIEEYLKNTDCVILHRDIYVSFFQDLISYDPRAKQIALTDFEYIKKNILFYNRRHPAQETVKIMDTGQIYPSYRALYTILTGASEVPVDWGYVNVLNIKTDTFIYYGTYMHPGMMKCVDLLFNPSTCKYIIINSEAVNRVRPCLDLDKAKNTVETLDTPDYPEKILYPKSNKVKKTIKEHNFLKIKLLTIK